MSDNAQEVDLGLEAEYLTVYIDDQMFGVPVLQIQDVLGEQKVTKIPLAPPEVDGALNLRGRIVTAINVRKRLGISGTNPNKKCMSVVVEFESELYSLLIDRVGDVLSIENKFYESNPATLNDRWREVSQGIYRLDGELLVILDVPKLLSLVHFGGA